MLGWLVAFGLMLYNDFAGYSSMARGISGLFGIELSRNFAIPYLSRNINEFWNRWHISLSHWLRDYIFFPINRALRKRIPNRRHLLNLVIPAMGTMLVSGLWHQTSLHMLLWGGLHGIFLIGAQLISRWRHMPPSDQQPLLRQFATGLVVLALVMMAWVPFGMNFTATLDFGQALLRWGHEGAPDVRILILLLPAILLDWIQHRTQDEVVFMRWPPLAQASIATVALLALFLVLRAEMTLEGFVYQGF